MSNLTEDPAPNFDQYQPVAVAILKRALEINGNGKVDPQDMWTAIREAIDSSECAEAATRQNNPKE